MKRWFALIGLCGCSSTDLLAPDEVVDPEPSRGSADFAEDPCDAFLDETGAKPLTVRVRNEGDSDIVLRDEWLGCATDAKLFSFASDDGQLQTGDPYACVETCGVLQETGDACLGAEPRCVDYGLRRIVPGGAVNLYWDGQLLLDAPMPLECYALTTLAEPTCKQRIAAPAGAYQLTVYAYESAECNGGSCDCASSTGVCYQWGEVDVASELTRTISFEHHEETIVVVEFE